MLNLQRQSLNFLFLIIFFINLSQNTFAGEYEDVRCKCLCPVTSIIDTNSSNNSNRKLYIDNVPPSQCNCDFVVLPKIAELSNKSAEFCPRCECKYESRNTTVIRFFVISIVCTLLLLSGYSFYLNVFDPWLIKSKYSSSLRIHYFQRIFNAFSQNLFEAVINNISMKKFQCTSRVQVQA